MVIVGEAAARRRNAAAYLAWEAGVGRSDIHEIDESTAALSLDGAEWVPGLYPASSGNELRESKLT